MSERRGMHRWRRFIHCRIQGRAGTYKAKIANLSTKGARIVEAEAVPRVNDSVVLFLQVGDSGETSLQGQVLYVSGTTFGVRFEGTKGSLLRKLGPLFADDDAEGGSGLDNPG